MGKGDKKSKRGKIWLGSYGVSRSRKAMKAKLKRVVVAKPEEVVAVPVVEAKPKAKRAPRKKEAAE